MSTNNSLSAPTVPQAGRDRVSATLFVSPAMCRISAANSAIKERCLRCLSDFRSDSLLMAPTSGLLSVKITKFLPSSRYWKCSRAANTASSSRSNVLYWLSAVLSFLEKNSSGFQPCPCHSCFSTMHLSLETARHIPHSEPAGLGPPRRHVLLQTLSSLPRTTAPPLFCCRRL
jgi:hypothetical protein